MKNNMSFQNCHAFGDGGSNFFSKDYVSQSYIGIQNSTFHKLTLFVTNLYFQSIQNTPLLRGSLNKDYLFQYKTSTPIEIAKRDRCLSQKSGLFINSQGCRNKDSWTTMKRLHINHSLTIWYCYVYQIPCMLKATSLSPHHI